jgi:hypothetical protein
MSQNPELAGKTGPSNTRVELVLASLMTAFGVLVVLGSLRAGIHWAFDGPQAGFFPFYIGLIIVASSVVNLIQIIKTRNDALFADWGQLRQVFSVVLPASIYVAIVPYIGIYVGSMLLIGFFMKWLGRYGWILTLVIAVGMPAITFVVFERWFLVALPKGPLEEMLGL